MTPRLARIALCGFAFLAGGVATNALYFQTRTGQQGRTQAERAPDRRPDRIGIERSGWTDPRAARQPLQANALKLENPPEPGASDGKPDTIRAIQRELSSRGFGPLTVDGVPGLATRAAILAFEADEGLGLTAIANETLLKNILLGVAADAPPPPREPSARAQDVIRVTQNWLLALGYQAGPANGLLTEDTKSAIRAFETSVGLAPKGRISADLVRRLADTVPLKSATRN